MHACKQTRCYMDGVLNILVQKNGGIYRCQCHVTVWAFNVLELISLWLFYVWKGVEVDL